MPQLDKTGPTGQGAQTGKKQGNCSMQHNQTEQFTPRRRGMNHGSKNSINDENKTSNCFGRRHGRGRDLGEGRNSQLN